MAKEQALTLTKVLRTASGNKVSPAGFLSAHKEFFQASPFWATIQPTYEKYENGDLFPSNALTILRRELFAFVQENNLLEVEARRVAKIQKAELKEQIRAEKLAEAAEAEANGEIPEGKKEKKYLAVILDERDNEILVDGKPLMKGFDKYQDAERWAARRILLDGTDSYERTEGNEMFNLNGWKAKIASPLQVDSEGNPIVTTLNRNQATVLLFPKKPNTACHIKRPSGGLSISMCNIKGSSHCHFSHGLGSLISVLW